MKIPFFRRNPNNGIFSRRIAVESLESRKLMSGTAIGIFASIPDASETAPTRAGRGEFVVKRTTGSTAHSLAVDYYVRSNSTASSGVDYQPLSGSVIILHGKRSAAINLIPIDNSTVDGDRTVIAILSPTTLTVTHRTGTVTIHDNDSVQPSGAWLDNTRNFRQAIDIAGSGTARTDEPVDNNINFTSILTSLNSSGSLVDNSIHVVEVNADGSAVIDDNVPFQFDKAANFDAATNASGDLIIKLVGSTGANQTRHYQVYFDTSGSFNAPSFSSEITTTDNTADLTGDNSSIKIETPTATYYYQKDTGGFSSIVDTEGNDWISWNSTPGSAGEFRGTPNLGPVGFLNGLAPTENNGTDPDTMTTQIVSQGPLKTTIVSTATDTGNKVMWEIYPTFARLTVLSMDRAYWFLYEATPGGGQPGGNTINSSDSVVESNGNVDDALFSDHDNSNTDFNHSGEEWTYVENSAVNSGNGRYIFLVHNNADNVTDSYYDLDNNMTVLGFGRNNVVNNSIPLLSGQNTFTIGLADGGGDFSASSTQIEGAYKTITGTDGAADVKPA